MKYATFNIQNNNIEVYNSILGVESVNLNGRKVSSGFSWFGKDHCFKIAEDNYLIKPEISFKHLGCVQIKVYKNGERVMLENQISSKNKSILIARMVISFCLGLFVGFGSIEMFDWIFKFLGIN